VTTTVSTTADSGVDNDYEQTDTVESATAALLSRWTDAEKPSEDDEGDKPTKKAPTEKDNGNDADEDANDGTDTDQNDEADEDTDSDDDDTDDGATKLADDDFKVKITVDGAERTVSVKDLKRLYGQEASLTRKSQEVATLRKAAEDNSARTSVALNTLTQRAEDRWRPYAEIDYLVAQTQLSSEDFATLRAEAKAASDDYTFLKSELDNHSANQQAERAATFREQAKECVEVLTRDLPNWNETLYNDIRAFGVKSGLPQADVDMIADPTIIKLLHSAMLYERGKTVATTKKVAAVKKTVKPTASAATVQNKEKGADGLKRLSNSGSREDAASLFLSRWEGMGED
jgi:hypothetical protein